MIAVFQSLRTRRSVRASANVPRVSSSAASDRFRFLKIEGSANEIEVSKALRKVAERPAAFRVDLFGKLAEIVGEAADVSNHSPASDVLPARARLMTNQKLQNVKVASLPGVPSGIR
jgi:hypothetical protein